MYTTNIFIWYLKISKIELIFKCVTCTCKEWINCLQKGDQHHDESVALKDKKTVEIVSQLLKVCFMFMEYFLYVKVI